jgi:uracil phosphoribosyltransferase
MQGVTIVTHPLVQHKLTLIRDKGRSTKSFRELFREIGALLCYEVTRDLPLEDIEIETPLTRMKAPQIAGKKLVFAPILRAGAAFVEGMLDLVPTARVAHIGLYRDPKTLVAVEYFFKAPSDLNERLVIVVDPMLATGNTAVAAIDRIKERGGIDVRRSTTISMRTPTSSRALATPATGRTEPGERRDGTRPVLASTASGLVRKQKQAATGRLPTQLTD